MSGGVLRGDIWHDTISIEQGADVLGQFLRHSQELQSSTTYQATNTSTSEPAVNGSAIFDDFYAKARSSQSNGENAPIKSARVSSGR
jgi:hypothetical protein